MTMRDFFKAAFDWIFSAKCADPLDKWAIKFFLGIAISGTVIVLAFRLPGLVLERLIPHPSFAYTVLEVFLDITFYATLFLYLMRFLWEFIKKLSGRDP